VSALLLSGACQGCVSGSSASPSHQNGAAAGSGSGSVDATAGANAVGGASSAGSPGTATTANPDGSAPHDATVGQNPLRRLGKLELMHTVRALLPTLPASFDVSAGLPEDNAIQLAFSLPGTVSDVEVKRFMDLAEASAKALAATSPGTTFDCAGADEPTCARAFIASFGKRAFRRPVDKAEVDDLFALYQKLRTDPDMAYDFRGALGVLVEAVLQSPGFIYRWERGLQAPQADGALVKLDDYEVASRLSYFIWNSMPDDELMVAAAAGQLSAPDEIAAQAQRLLADPRADETLGDFVSQWLELGNLPSLIKDKNAFPDFNAQLATSMANETLAFTHDVLRGSSPTFTSLLTAKYTFVDPALAKYYGVAADGTGRVDLSANPRLGLLTQASLMAAKGNSYRTSPVRRGKFIINRLLCTVVPPPPPNVVPELPPPNPMLTVRQQMAEHRSSPACASCHTQMDALGFAFEHFDGAGKQRELDGKNAIDSSGSVQLDGATLSFANASELSTGLSKSATAQHCFARQWLRYAIDRFEQDADSSATKSIENSYSQGGLDTRALIVAITRTLPFTHRAPAPGEVLAP
jgi:hypothetical protein